LFNLIDVKGSSDTEDDKEIIMSSGALASLKLAIV
jgi:hypothetical protein